MLRPSTVLLPLTDCPRRLQRGEEDEEDVGAVDGHPGMAGMGREAPRGGGGGGWRRDHRGDGMTLSLFDGAGRLGGVNSALSASSSGLEWKKTSLW